MRKPFLLILIICFSLTRCQCEPDIEDNQRSLFNGKITNSESSPLENINVSVKVSDLNLGAATTSLSGNFEFISLVSTFRDYSIIINPVDVASEYSNFRINYLERIIDRTNNLGNISLPRKSVLKLRIRNNSNNPISLKYNIEFAIAECNIFDENSVIINYNNCFETQRFSDEITPSFANIDAEFNSILNTTATLTYRIENGESQTVLIQLNQTEITYDLDY